MLYVDLGVLTGPVLVFGGPYSNLHATRDLFAEANRRGIDAAHTICTGDVVAYCAAPAETLAMVRASGCVVVAGNCERQLAAGEMDCGCGFERGTTCDLLSRGWFAHVDQEIDTGARAWMAGLPDMVGFTHNGKRWVVLHGGASDISRFLWPTTSNSAFAEEIGLVRSIEPDLTGIIAGHSGIPFHRVLDGVDWVNAGVIGMPPNDGGSATRYMILDESGVSFHELIYDAQSARTAMQNAGLVQGYHAALTTGYWPSEDVLPPELKVAK